MAECGVLVKVDEEIIDMATPIRGEVGVELGYAKRQAERMDA
jgi:hypothetical protein